MVGDVLPGVPRISLALGRTAGVVGQNMEPKTGHDIKNLRKHTSGTQWFLLKF